MPDSRNPTSVLTLHCMASKACKARSANRTNYVLCKCVNLWARARKCLYCAWRWRGEGWAWLRRSPSPAVVFKRSRRGPRTIAIDLLQNFACPGQPDGRRSPTYLTCVRLPDVCGTFYVKRTLRIHGVCMCIICVYRIDWSAARACTRIYISAPHTHLQQQIFVHITTPSLVIHYTKITHPFHIACIHTHGEPRSSTPMYIRVRRCLCFFVERRYHCVRDIESRRVLLLKYNDSEALLMAMVQGGDHRWFADTYIIVMA